MNQSEPPSLGSHPFFIGRDSHGNWVVQDRRHRCGGLFVSRNEALKFALFENGNHPRAIVMVPGILELDIEDRPGTARRWPGNSPARRAA